MDGVINAVLLVFALVYGLFGIWGLVRLIG